LNKRRKEKPSAKTQLYRPWVVSFIWNYPMHSRWSDLELVWEKLYLDLTW